VGNPPYVRQESIKELKPELKEIYSVFTGTADLFVYFYELAQNILKVDGINGFICSNKFFRAKYGQKLREMILNKTTIKSIVDFNAVKVFEDATVDSAITILQKGFKENSSFQISLNNYNNFFDMAQQDLTKDSFSFVTPQELAIKKKIEKVGTPLKEWDIKIYRGILTGFNEAFIIDGAKKDELIKADIKNREIIKPLLRGRDIKKYSYDFADKWVIGTFPSLNIDINDYPMIKEYLHTFGKRINQTGEKGSRKKTKNKWFETQDQIAYHKEFEQEKIVYNQIGNDLRFYLDKNNFYCNDKLYFITSTNLNLTYLTAILNSQLLQYYFSMIFNFGGGKGKDTFKNIPIPNIPKSYKVYNMNIDKLLETKKDKKIFDTEKRLIAIYKNSQNIYISEFTYAKIRGYIDSLHSHPEIEKNYFKLLPYIFENIDNVYKNSNNDRLIYSVILDNKKRRMLHVVEDGLILSVYIVRDKSFQKQLDNGRFKEVETNQQGRTANPFIVGELLPHSLQRAVASKEAFWRQTDLLEILYQKLDSKSISQEPFINLVNIIIDSKEKIAKYNKHFESLNAIDKIEIKEEIEKLEILVQESIDEIDRLVYRLYGLSDEEIGIVGIN